MHKAASVGFVSGQCHLHIFLSLSGFECSICDAQTTATTAAAYFDLLDVSELRSAQFTRSRHLRHLVSLRRKAFHSGYFFKLIEGCFGDGSDVTVEGQIWVYQHAKVSYLVFILSFKRQRFKVFTERPQFFLDLIKGNFDSPNFWFALNSDTMTPFDCARHKYLDIICMTMIVYIIIQ